jgi:glutamine synthetase
MAKAAAMRICLPPKGSAEATRRLYNLEFRPADGTANPYIALGALVRAGLAGIAEKLPLPPLMQEDPHDIGPEKRRALGIVALPSTLGEALDRLEGDAVVKSWFARNLWSTYIAVKRKEIEVTADLGPDDICERYRNAY